MYVVTVTFHIHAEAVERFMPLMLAQAANSLRDEPECRVFDVCQDPEVPTTVFLYEIYNDRAAFNAHLASAHFKEFDRQVAPLVADKQVKTFERVSP